MDRRIKEYKSGEYGARDPKQTIVIVDDGLATGLTATAAIKSVKKTYQPKTLIFAAPVCAKDSAQKLREIVDDVVCVAEVTNLLGIGYWYEDFEQTSDQKVIECLIKLKSYNH